MAQNKFAKVKMAIVIGIFEKRFTNNPPVHKPVPIVGLLIYMIQ